jgi:hypothetical protein
MRRAVGALCTSSSRARAMPYRLISNRRSTSRTYIALRCMLNLRVCIRCSGRLRDRTVHDVAHALGIRSIIIGVQRMDQGAIDFSVLPGVLARISTMYRSTGIKHTLQSILTRLAHVPDPLSSTRPLLPRSGPARSCRAWRPAQAVASAGDLDLGRPAAGRSAATP